MPKGCVALRHDMSEEGSGVFLLVLSDSPGALSLAWCKSCAISEPVMYSGGTCSRVPGLVHAPTLGGGLECDYCHSDCTDCESEMDGFPKGKLGSCSQRRRAALDKHN